MKSMEGWDGWSHHIVFKDTDGKFKSLCQIQDAEVRKSVYYRGVCHRRSKRSASQWVQFFNHNYPHIIFQKRTGECPFQRRVA